MHRALRRVLSRARWAPAAVLVLTLGLVLGGDLAAPTQATHTLAAAAIPDDDGASFRIAAARPTVAAVPQVDALEERASEPERASRALPRAAHVFHRPAGGPLTSYYGMRWGKLHRGIDIGASYGSPVYAVTDGDIASATVENGYGNTLQVRGWDGLVTAYAHLSRFARTSGPVEAGDVIGYVGRTGSTTGPHLHFELRVNGVAINPLPYLRAHGLY